jgi:hypothetical protein
MSRGSLSVDWSATGFSANVGSVIYEVTYGEPIHGRARDGEPPTTRTTIVECADDVLSDGRPRVRSITHGKRVIRGSVLVESLIKDYELKVRQPVIEVTVEPEADAYVAELDSKTKTTALAIRLPNELRDWLSSEADRMNAAEPGRDAGVSEVARILLTRAMLTAKAWTRPTQLPLGQQRV